MKFVLTRGGKEGVDEKSLPTSRCFIYVFFDVWAVVGSSVLQRTDLGVRRKRMSAQSNDHLSMQRKITLDEAEVSTR